MIINSVETKEVKRWDKVEFNTLKLTIENYTLIYALDIREQQLFREGLNPKEVIKIITYGDKKTKILCYKVRHLCLKLIDKNN